MVQRGMKESANGEIKNNFDRFVVVRSLIFFLFLIFLAIRRDFRVPANAGNENNYAEKIFTFFNLNFPSLADHSKVISIKSTQNKFQLTRLAILAY